MGEPLRVDVSPLWLVRLRGRAPRIALLTLAGVLSVAGVKSIVRPPAPPAAEARHAPVLDVAVLGLAQRFARAYLTWDPRHPDGRQAQLAAFGRAFDALSSDDLGTSPRSVSATTVVGDELLTARREVVTVAADDGATTTYLAVTVAKDAAGRPYVPAPPAIVGPPLTASTEPTPEEVEVGDPALRAVAARVVRNYLARDRSDLAADLSPASVVSLPPEALKVRSVDAITWAGPRRVGVAVTAEGAGLQLSLRYDLDLLLRGGRWLVRTIEVNPLDQEASG